MVLYNNLGTGEMQIVVNHVQGSVAKDFFKRKNVTTIKQVIDCKGMPVN